MIQLIQLIIELNTMNTMNTIDILAHKREVERVRQSRFYENNKEKLNEQRRQKYLDKKTVLAEQAKAVIPDITDNKPVISKNGKIAVIISDDNVNKNT